MCALEGQAHQLGLQASQESERMTSERTLALQMLQKVSALFGRGADSLVLTALTSLLRSPVSETLGYRLTPIDLPQTALRCTLLVVLIFFGGVLGPDNISADLYAQISK